MCPTALHVHKTVTVSHPPRLGGPWRACMCVVVTGMTPRRVVYLAVPCRASQLVATSGLDVFAHNIETVERLQGEVRDRRAGWRQSLSVLAGAKEAHAKHMAEAGPGSGRRLLTKSSIMLGCGETQEEVVATFKALRCVGGDGGACVCFHGVVASGVCTRMPASVCVHVYTAAMLERRQGRAADRCRDSPVHPLLTTCDAGAVRCGAVRPPVLLPSSLQLSLNALAWPDAGQLPPVPLMLFCTLVQVLSCHVMSCGACPTR